MEPIGSEPFLPISYENQIGMKAYEQNYIVLTVSETVSYLVNKIINASRICNEKKAVTSASGVGEVAQLRIKQ